jgi:hypothetical protein
MPLFEQDPQLNVSEEIATFFLFMLEEDRIPVPKLSLPQIIFAKSRPGMSSELLASSVISRFGEIGIPTGAIEDGTNNVMEAFVKAFSEEIVDHIQSQCRVDLAVDVGIKVQATGGNAGGPVVAVGASIAPHTGTGVPR